MTKQSDSSYNVTIQGINQTITQVLVSAWSNQNGVDDIKWYTANKQANGDYTVTIDMSNHKNDVGLYNVYVLGNSTVTGGLIGLNTATFSRQIDQGKFSVEASLNENGIAIQLNHSIDINPSNLYYAVWSAENEQDDLKWYRANSSGNALAAYENHTGYGTYHVHSYYNQDGQLVGLASTSLTIAKPDIKTSIVEDSEFSFTLTVSNVPVYISSITVPVWSLNNDQDDLKWYTATKKSNGDYELTVYISNHYLDLGTYVVHVYGQNKLGNEGQIGLANTDCYVRTSVIPGSHYNTKTQAITLTSLTPTQFIDTVGPLFIQDQRYTGILASISLAQFILESGWGQELINNKCQ